MCFWTLVWILTSSRAQAWWAVLSCPPASLPCSAFTIWDGGWPHWLAVLAQPSAHLFVHYLPVCKEMTGYYQKCYHLSAAYPRQNISLSGVKPFVVTRYIIVTENKLCNYRHTTLCGITTVVIFCKAFWHVPPAAGLILQYATWLVTRTSERTQNKSLWLRGCHTVYFPTFNRWEWANCDLDGFCHDREMLCRHSLVGIDSDDVWNISNCREGSRSGGRKCCGDDGLFLVSFYHTLRKYITELTEMWVFSSRNRVDIFFSERLGWPSFTEMTILKSLALTRQDSRRSYLPVSSHSGPLANGSCLSQVAYSRATANTRLYYHTTTWGL